MKYLIATDIHGSADSANVILKKFEKIKADKIILLGDILYHGPRNDLPENYNPKKVTELLNSVSDKIVAVQGNCDAEVDQMVLNFELHKEVLFENFGKKYFLTHGHHINASEPADLDVGTTVLHGHTHVIKKDIVDGVEYLNIGSITLPKNGTPKCYAVLDENGVKVYDLNDNEVVF